MYQSKSLWAKSVRLDDRRAGAGIFAFIPAERHSDCHDAVDRALHVTSNVQTLHIRQTAEEFPAMHGAVRTNVVPLRLARTREGDPDGDHPAEVRCLPHVYSILIHVIYCSVLSVKELIDAKIFLILATVGHYSLLPLLYPNSLLVIKVLLLVLHSFYAFHSLSKIYPLAFCKYSLPLLASIESLYLLGLIAVFLYEHVIHNFLGFDEILPFLPLMLTSLYCSVGVVYCWLRYYVYFMYNHLERNKTN